MTTCAEFCSIFDLSSKEEIFGLKEVNHDFKESFRADCLEDKSPDDVHLLREVSDKMLCSACRCAFVNREEQKEHYKLDWHRFNLRQKVSGLNPLTAEEFEKKTGAGDLSSISGSESDSEEEDLACKSGETRNNVGTDDESSAITGRHSSKVVFQNSAGVYLMVYQAAVMGKTKEEVDAVISMKSISQKTVWVILVTGGGHFAGAVFEGKEVLHHKTFHRYTVRAKRGTTQGLRDSQSRVTAKSAGATLRRYNEAALVKDIQDLLVTWAEHLDKASAIFVRAPSYNKTIFFGGRGAPLGKKDPRIRSIPFATRRATFREVQRIHQVLSTVHVYGKETDMSSVVSPSNKRVWKRTVKPAAQKIPDQEADLLQPPPEEGPESSDEGGEIQLEIVELTLGTLDLRENEIYPSRHRKRKRRNKEGKHLKEEKSNMEAENQEEEEHEATPAEENTQSSTKRKTKAQSKKQDDVVESCEYGLRDALFTACKVGDVGALSSLLKLPQEMPDSCEELESNPSLVLSPVSLLTKPVDSSGFTLLHVAAAAAQKAVVRLLLDAGADPACRDKKGQTPYTVTPDKETRNVFRKYMGENPDKYDYSRTQIPGPLTEEIESKKAEKKKAQKAQRKQREKEQKEKKKQELEEEEERRRFASLTDREKRALAAERRLAEQAAATGVGLSNVKRCWMCGESLLGKIPFHCLEYAFCSPRCVQAHRKANVPTGKT